MATTPPSASWRRASARPVGSGHMCGMTGPSPDLRRRRRSVTPRATDAASIHRSIWPPSPVSCKPIAATASSRCSIRRRRCCRLRRRFASPMRGGASSSWPTSRRTPGKATGANRSLRSRWRRSPSATTALTKPASDLVRFAAKAFRQVTSRERDKPSRRAVAATRRGSDRLSKTIRAFCSSDQRRRQPVSTTSSRSSARIVWLSIRTVLNHQASSSQGVFPRRLTELLPWERKRLRQADEPRRSAGRLTFTQCLAIIEPAVPTRMRQSAV
ncbi:hypothetical protein ACVWXQ_000035 [Bradyrhizobium sp. S3.14.4]